MNSKNVSNRKLTETVAVVEVITNNRGSTHSSSIVVGEVQVVEIVEVVNKHSFVAVTIV